MDTQKVTQEYRMNKWIKVIQECRNSGKNVSSWCKENEIKTNSYYYWLRKIRDAACNALPSLNSQDQIVPLEIPSEIPPISTDSANVSSETSQADIVLRLGSTVLEINNSASTNLIENVLRVIKDAR